jgi:hypothetical protein
MIEAWMLYSHPKKWSGCLGCRVDEPRSSPDKDGYRPCGCQVANCDIGEAISKL